MPNFNFERPILVFAAIALPIAVAVARYFLRNAFSLSLSLGPPGGESFKSPLRVSIAAGFFRALEVLGAIILLLAAAGPEIITNSVVYLDRGADIIFVLDDSPSMAGLDIGGKSRFDAARELIRDFSLRRPADAIGLITVGNDAALLIPPTTDRDALFSRLDKLQIGELGDGTALGMGLSVAALHLEKSAAPRKAAVIITDGENNAGSIHPETAAAALAAVGATLYVIAAGTTGEVPIDYVDPFTHIRRTGSFDSRFNPDALARIAAAANGTFIAAPSPDAFAEAFSRIGKEEMTISRTGIRGKRIPAHRMLLIIGLGFVSFAVLVKKMILGAFL